MPIEVKVPQLPESVADATLISWHKSPGDAVNRDESLVELETDKVVLEVPAPVSGVIRELKVQNGVTVKSGELLAILEAVEDKAAAAAVAVAAPQAPPAVPPVVERSAGKSGPAVRRAAAEAGIDPAQLAGSGRAGRVLKADIPTAAPGAALPPSVGARQERRVPMSRLRARIAQRLLDAQQTAAMLTTFNEVDLTAVMALRSRYKDAFEKQHGVKLGFMPFFVKASIEALRHFPVVNASVEGGDIVHHDYYDVGIAVSTERGLIVPILRDADRLSFAQVEGAIADFGRRAREGTVGMEDLTGGTFTITNGGTFGSLLSTPILNPPQSAILGMHKIQERPMVVDGAVVPRPMMYLALTYDHRIIDGKEAVQFVVAVKDALEEPGRLLLQI
ncbi:MAG: 2-oxoglutarate dehydrogenase complex dihydrolipoyllysine-residue succinyltransferase [Gammaproteobacteria bacterium]|nr:2-oxoglutarate dehydrogenase complex dihydrolipoyllysine-residue succinyltransferase [Gammaproteobacteria bacterium]